MNTENILFICGGAFSHLDKIIERRVSKKSVGFGAEIVRKEDRNIGEVLSMVETEDLLKYGFIPEFVGRFSIIATLDGLNEQDLVRILTEPRHALVKQYQRFFEMENVRLEFSPDSLQAIAEAALQKGTGARALRSILEEMMLDVMYEIPSQRHVTACRITRDVVEGKREPELIREFQITERSA